MPTYRARGVTASLATCDLQASLSHGISLTQGPAQQANAKRLQQVFSYAQKLPERPIGQDGSERGVVQFIGLHEDMPLYVVEAGEGIYHRRAVHIDGATAHNARQDEAIAPLGPAHPPPSDDSPLTSLATTPLSTQESFPHPPRRPSTPPARRTAASMASLKASSLRKKTPAAPGHSRGSAAQALVLDVDFSASSFLPELKKTRTVSQGFAAALKIEVFLNGQLADVAIVNEIESRRLAIQHAGKDKARFAGTRIHRQVEKPWTYTPTTNAGESQLDAQVDAANRWEDLCTSFRQEADIRGRNQFGDSPPSADFILALAGLGLPTRLKALRNIATIDVVITLGQGRKYGPETTYLMKPTRMDDQTYEFPNSAPHIATEDSHTALPTQLDVPALTDSPETPFSQPQLTPILKHFTPVARRTVDFARDLGLDLDPRKKSLLGSYENAHGWASKGGRTLRQRLGDVKKMKPENMDAELERLKGELGMQERPKKRVKFDNEMDLDFESFMSNGAAEIAETVNPAQLFKDAPVLLPAVDEGAVLTQKRIDMALEAGAAGNGPLLRRIASLSPQRTPVKHTRASSLANSPASVPVKTPKQRGRVSLTPQRRKADAVESAGPKEPVTPAARSASPTPRSRPGSNRTFRAWDPKEQTVSEVLKAFEVPPSCQGSCVSFDEDESVVRQIGKARGGEFREETLLVGMRFVVV